jgi:hypothetical protein
MLLSSKKQRNLLHSKPKKYGEYFISNQTFQIDVAIFATLVLLYNLTSGHWGSGKGDREKGSGNRDKADKGDKGKNNAPCPFPDTFCNEIVNHEFYILLKPVLDHKC